MEYSKRIIEPFVHHEIKRGKSILLLGPRQTGKTTLIEQAVKPDASFSFANLIDYLRYAATPTLLLSEWDTIIASSKGRPLIFIDEI